MNTFFTLTHKDKKTQARTGIIHTDHGDISTPAFMPVGTQGTVKSIDQDDLRALDAEIILGNTYHLHLRPGEDLISKFGGLHKFMHWNKPILTDSGGFQVFSLGQQKNTTDPRKFETDEAKKTESNNAGAGQGKLVSIDEDGVTFRSHLDGSTHRFTPEISIQIQHKIGADIIMAFDECTPDAADEKYTRAAMKRTHRWAVRSLDAHKKFEPTDYHRFLFGIIQGANHKELREESAKFIANLDFDGIAIGGESIGYNMAATANILDWVNPFLPEDKPHYTMGVGYSPTDLFAVVEKGVDMFDCVAPTRIARNGTLFTHKKTSSTFKININNAQFRNDPAPVDPDCSCYTCATYTRAYVHHLFRAEELLAYRLATLHNLHFFLDLMREMREAIAADGFGELKREWMG